MVSQVEQELLTLPVHLSSSPGFFEDTKGVIKIRKSKKNRQHNGQKKKDKQRSTKHTQKVKDRVMRAPLKPGDTFLAWYRLCSDTLTHKYMTVHFPGLAQAW
jgi:hypothetical protein